MDTSGCKRYHYGESPVPTCESITLRFSKPRLLGAILVVSLIGSAAAANGAPVRRATAITGLTIRATVKVPLKNRLLYAFAPKTSAGVKCGDFQAQASFPPNILTSGLTVLEGSANGKPACGVIAPSLTFLTRGTQPLSFQITESGPITGTDTVTDTAIVARDNLLLAEGSITRALAAEDKAATALARKKFPAVEKDLNASVDALDLAKVEVKNAVAAGQLVSDRGNTARSELSRAAGLDQEDASNARGIASGHLQGRPFVKSMKDRLEFADDAKREALAIVVAAIRSR